MDGHSFEIDTKAFLNDHARGPDSTPSDVAHFDQFLKKELNISKELEMYPHIVSSFPTRCVVPENMSDYYIEV